MTRGSWRTGFRADFLESRPRVEFIGKNGVVESTGEFVSGIISFLSRIPCFRNAACALAFRPWRASTDCVQRARLARCRERISTMHSRNEGTKVHFSDCASRSALRRFMNEAMDPQFIEPRREPASASEVAKLSLRLIKAGTPTCKQCVICLCSLRAHDWAIELPCTHEFHRACILRWLQCTHTCPCCRFPLLTACPRVNAAVSRRRGALRALTRAAAARQQDAPLSNGTVLPFRTRRYRPFRRSWRSSSSRLAANRTLHRRRHSSIVHNTSYTFRRGHEQRM